MTSVMNVIRLETKSHDNPDEVATRGSKAVNSSSGSR